jgi:hypothetical protein
MLDKIKNGLKKAIEAVKSFAAVALGRVIYTTAATISELVGNTYVTGALAVGVGFELVHTVYSAAELVYCGHILTGLRRLVGVPLQWLAAAEAVTLYGVTTTVVLVSGVVSLVLPNTGRTLSTIVSGLRTDMVEDISTIGQWLSGSMSSERAYLTMRARTERFISKVRRAWTGA